MEYLLGIGAIKPYRWIFSMFVLVGAVVELDIVWGIADVFNGLMAFPNLVGLIALTPVVIRETRNFFSDAV